MPDQDAVQPTGNELIDRLQELVQELDKLPPLPTPGVIPAEAITVAAHAMKSYMLRFPQPQPYATGPTFAPRIEDVAEVALFAALDILHPEHDAKAIARVRELHTPVTYRDRTVCAHCCAANGSTMTECADGHDHTTGWVCATLAALDEPQETRNPADFSSGKLRRRGRAG